LIFSKVAHNAVLISQGRFSEALKSIDAIWTEGSDPQRIGSAAQRAVIYRALGRYDEALAAQNDMETRYEKLTNPLSTARAMNRAHHKIHQSWNLTSRLTSIGMCLEAGNPGAASEIWYGLPAEVIDEKTEALRYATGAWLFAVRGNEEAARRLIAEQPRGSDPEQQPAILALQGRALFALHDYGAAIERFQMALVACAGRPLAEAETRVLLAVCYAKQEKYDLAMAEYEKVIAAGFEEAVFTQEARAQLARLRTNTVTDGEKVRLRAMNR
jgi:tetratricopeptide (TPR) repeat protein